MTEDIETLLQRVDKSDGEEVYQYLTSLNQGLQICERNYTDLSETVQTFEADAQESESLSKKFIEKFVIDVSRHLHNFVAATFSVYNHTESAKSKFFKSDEQNTIREKSKDIFGNRSQFLARLRAFMQKPGFRK